jgi:hypothetical protein
MGKKNQGLIPLSSESDFEADVLAATENLLKNNKVKKFDSSIDKEARIASIKAVSVDGRSATTDIIGPGLTATMNYNPSDRAARDANIVNLFNLGYSQVDSARILNVSQPLVSKVQRRLGLR